MSQAARKLRDDLTNPWQDLTFSYNGKDYWITFEAWNGVITYYLETKDSYKSFKDLDELMTAPICDGKSLEWLADKIDIDAA